MDVISMAKEGESNALTISLSQSALRQQLTKDQIEGLREQREAHKHKTIWTKDPHGGPYKKATGGQGIDPLKENLDGSTKSVALGHEVAEVGPTSNFVGNHMTQGAIDMVQALLQMRVKEKVVDSKPPQRIESGGLPDRGPLPCEDSTCMMINDPQDRSYKSLNIVESREIEVNKTMIILERPYAEDITCSMSLSTTFETRSVDIRFSITAKDGTMIKQYCRKIENVSSNIDVEKCACYLGSGTIEELKASDNIANRTINVSHSDSSTMICILLHTVLEEGRKSKAKDVNESAVWNDSPALLSDVHGMDHLAALKSFIRKSRAMT